MPDQFLRQRALLVVGNGSISVGGDGRRYINAHTGRFLTSLRDRGLAPIILDMATAHRRDGNLQDFCLDDAGVASIILDGRGWAALLRSLSTLLISCVQARCVYLFFPGRLSRIAGTWCRLIRRSYGLYVRGSQYQDHGTDAWILRGARFILAVSPSIEADLRRFCSHVATVRPMLEVTGEDALVRNALTSGPQPWRLLFVGRLEAAKGVPELLQAVEILRTRMEVTLTLVGGGPLYDEVMQRGDSAVTCTGLVGDRHALTGLYRQAHLLVLPTHHEGFPRVLYEAMVTGLPVMTTMVGGIPGRMTDGHTCVAIPVGDPVALADAIFTITRDLPRLNAIGKRGQALALDVLTTTVDHAELLAGQVARLARG